MALPSKLDSKYNYAAWKKTGYEAPGLTIEKSTHGFSKTLIRINELLGNKKKGANDLAKLAQKLIEAAHSARMLKSFLSVPLQRTPQSTISKSKKFLKEAEAYYNELKEKITPEMIDAAKNNDDNDDKIDRKKKEEHETYQRSISRLGAFRFEFGKERVQLESGKKKLKQAIDKAKDFIKNKAAEIKKRKGGPSLDKASFEAFDKEYCANIFRPYRDSVENTHSANLKRREEITEIAKKLSSITNKEYIKRFTPLLKEVCSCQRDCESLANEIARLQSDLAIYCNQKGPILYMAYCGKAFRAP